MSRIFFDPQLEERFARCGFVVLPFLDQAGVTRLREAWETLGRTLDNAPFSISTMSTNTARRLALSAAIEEVSGGSIARLLDGYRFCAGNFLVKRPAGDSQMPLHQDPTYVDESRYEPVNFWIAISDVQRQNGCLRLMPGSHRLNRGPRGTNRRFPYPELLHEIRSRYLVDVELAPGWACASNLRTFHESSSNRTSADRIAASALAVPAESEICYLDQRGTNIDVFHVDDAFMRTQVFAAPVLGRAPAARLTASADPVDSEALERVFREAQSGPHR